MDGGPLGTSGKTCVAEVDGVEHRRARAVVERHELAHKPPATARDANGLHPPLFNMGVADNLGVSPLHGHVGMQPAISQNAGQIVHIRDVINRNVFRLMAHVRCAAPPDCRIPIE